MISVIICTYNPDLIKLNRVLNALRNQSLSYINWELLVIDNSSRKPIIDQIDLSWHPNARVLVESKLGLTHARVCGILNSKGNLLVFVDDDNLLNSNYLELAQNIAKERTYLGCFGGNQIGEFEVQPEIDVIGYLEYIAVRKISENRISNMYDWNTTPAGAGQVIRKEIALTYASNISGNQARLKLDRKGSNLSSSGDIDLAYTSIDCGYLNGLFPELKLIHLIPKERVSKEYLLKLQFYNEMSNCILEYERFKKWPNAISRTQFLFDNFVDLVRLNLFGINMRIAKRKGLKQAIKQISNNE